MGSADKEISQIIQYLLESKGKMIRPRLVYLSASIYPHDAEMVRDLAVVIELIHMASLVHDDIIDNASIRRGRESINSRWGNHASVLTGDYFFATAFNLINQHGKQDITDNISKSIQIMCAGEIKQMALAFNSDISEEEYLEKTFGKTACLFASSCKTGALASSMPENEVRSLEEFGLCLGYAYQILDDLLDFLSDSMILGKPAANDLLEGNITLPVIYALRDRKYGVCLRNLIRKPELIMEKLEEIVDVLIESKAVEDSLNCSREFLNQGLKSLDELPESSALKELKAMTVYLMDEYYQKLNNYSNRIQKVVK